MKLPSIRRRRSRTQQVLGLAGDAVKLWSTLRLTKVAGRGVKTAGKGFLVARLLPLRALGLAAVAGGLGAVILKRRQSSDAADAPYVPAPSYGAPKPAPDPTPASPAAAPRTDPKLDVDGPKESSPTPDPAASRS